MASSSMELRLGYLGFYRPLAKQNANKMHPRSSRHAVLHACLSSCSDPSNTLQTNHGFFDREKNLNTQIGAHAKIKDGTGSGISGLYLWGYHMFSIDHVTSSSLYVKQKMIIGSEVDCMLRGHVVDVCKISWLALHPACIHNRLKWHVGSKGELAKSGGGKTSYAASCGGGG